MVAMPKSESNISCRLPTSMFSGLTSRWMNFCSWAYCKASATCLTTETITGSGTRLPLGYRLEVLGFLLTQMGMQHLDSRLLLEAHMLAQVDFGVATLSQQVDQPVV